MNSTFFGRKGLKVNIVLFPALAEAVKKAADTGREAYSEKCRAFAEQEIDKVKQIEKYLKPYEDLTSAEVRNN